MRPRISTNLHVEMYFDFIASSYARNGFLANVMLLDALKKQFQGEATQSACSDFSLSFLRSEENLLQNRAMLGNILRMPNRQIPSVGNAV